MNFDFKNGFKDEFQGNKEKSCSWFKKGFPQKIAFRAVGTHESHPIVWELNYNNECLKAIKLNERFSDLIWSISIQAEDTPYDLFWLSLEKNNEFEYFWHIEVLFFGLEIIDRRSFGLIDLRIKHLCENISRQPKL